MKLTINKLITLIMFLTLMTVTASSFAAPIDPGIYKDSTINCVMPTEREDGTILTPEEIAGVIFYWGNASGDYQMSSGLQPACQYTHPNIPNTTTYFVGVVEDTEGRQSVYSTPEVVIEVGGITADPKPMTEMTVTPNRSEPQ